MQNDQLDQRDPSEPENLDDLRRDPATEPPQEPLQSPPPSAPEPAMPEEPAAAEPPAGSWPSEDFADRDEEPPAAPTGEPAPWPDERPPAEQPQTESAAQPPAHEPPPSEVEAYPTAAGGEAEATQAPPAHSVPAAGEALGESTLCPRCGTENRPGLAFCRNCGQRLMAAGAPATVERPSAPEGTQACPRCGTHNRAGVAFCQNCGANLRTAAPGYVPPAVETGAAGEAAVAAEPRRAAVLGPVVLLIATIGIGTAYLLPFLYGTGSLFERAFGSGGYGVAFWSGYPEVTASLADQAYFGLTGPAPLVGLLLVALAIGGFVRAVPGAIQTVGLVVALLWAVGVVVLFLMVELVAHLGGDLVGLLGSLSPAGIIVFLSALIVLIGVLTRFARS